MTDQRPQDRLPSRTDPVAACLEADTGLPASQPSTEACTAPRECVAILGATGSIGTATLEVLRHLQQLEPGRGWQPLALSGHRNWERIREILATFSGGPCRGPELVVLSHAEAAARARSEWHDGDAGSSWQLAEGSDALVRAAEHPGVGTVVAAIVGRAGLESTLAAIDAGKRVALANKETLVVAGSLVQDRRRRSGAELLPVDSEHAAIFQCLAADPRHARRLILTASGGPFREWSGERMARATPGDALAHPTWEMGPKITIDSATMMNKALEIIEARWLFDVPADAIEVVVHPQSVIHSLVEFDDGSVVAQLSPPDMKLPIQYALTYPRRLPGCGPTLDRGRTWELHLEPVDRERFPAIDLGFEVASVGGTAGVVVNAANEAAVGLFLDGQIRFTEIVPACRRVLEHHNHESAPRLEQLLRLDLWARDEVQRSNGARRPAKVSATRKTDS